MIAVGYPDEALDAEHLALLRGAISKEIDGTREGPMPRFRGAFLKGEAIVVRPMDAGSLAWLEGRVSGISPWEGARLKVVGLEALQKQRRVVVWVPGPPEGSAAVLARLERQNPGLSTAGWRVHVEGAGATRDGSYLVLGVPESSVRKLRTLDFKLFLGLDQLTLRVSGPQEESSGKEGAAPVV